ncbi:hypothetical protein CCACVL1_10210 [Corchorus capsularis]|uniref:Uncharacterized protein n=1 Tax=Corchorus capsularis TaxID=210143 RepID=A0A1R3IS16_COCAP|nr:hypothetical protein CCACVL1_10210 [Corchorus capsularis]
MTKEQLDFWFFGIWSVPIEAKRPSKDGYGAKSGRRPGDLLPSRKR